MNKIKIAKELIKLAKSLVANDIDEQTQVKLDLAAESGKKYILHHKEGSLWRIQACKDFYKVKKGDFGGLIESEKNLSHEGKCWVFDSAKIYDNAFVTDDAKIYNNALIYGEATIQDGAIIQDKARVYDKARINDYVQICDNASVFDNALIQGVAIISGKAKIHGKAQVDYDVTDEEITE